MAAKRYMVKTPPKGPKMQALARISPAVKPEVAGCVRYSVTAVAVPCAAANK